MIEIIKEQLVTEDTVTVVIEDSKWNGHCVDGYITNNLRISTAYTEGDGFGAAREKAIQYYLDNENRFYELLMEKIKRLLEFEDFYGDYDFEPAFEANEIELPEIITQDWIKKNVKLSSISILEEKGLCFLEFDFNVYRDEEHGMKVLLYKGKVLDIAEGGYCWTYDID